MKLLVKVQKHPYLEQYRALFRTYDVPEEHKDKTVSLSRVPDHCFFTLDSLDDHDQHAPPYNSKEELLVYINRIRADIEALVGPLDTETKESKPQLPSDPDGGVGVDDPDED